MNNKVKFFKIETFGAVDGPGSRLIIFLQGCPLRCLYCHNPESWDLNKETNYITIDEIISLYKKNESFYKNNGGITISGGEPCLHMDFLINLGKMCKKENIHYTIDTSSYFFKKGLETKFNELIQYVDLWLVDIKHINPDKYSIIVNIPNAKQTEIEFINFLERNQKKYWIRQVLLPSYTDDKNDLINLGKFIGKLKFMEKFEILPYHEYALNKYKELNIEYKLHKIKPPSSEEIRNAMDAIKTGMQEK